MDSEEIDRSVQRRMRDILTSYEMVWAILRRDPRSAYLELENQPAAKVEYTFSLETHRNKIILIGIKKEGWE